MTKYKYLLQNIDVYDEIGEIRTVILVTRIKLNCTKIQILR